MTDKLLLIIPEGPTLESLKAELGEECELIIRTEWDEALITLAGKRRELTALLVDLDFARENGDDFL